MAAPLLVAVAAVVLPLLSSSSSATAGDAALAKFLLKGGKDDLAKKQYDPAFTKFERAEREDPTLAEAIYCQALTLERKGDNRGAIQTYRRFVTAADLKVKAATASKDEIALQKKALERVDALDVARTERRKLDDGFVEALMTFARANFVKDPAIVVQALRIVLGLRPDHDEAKRLFEKVKAAAPAAAADADGPGMDAARPPDAAPAAGFAAVKAWKDLVAAKTFGDGDGWSYESDRLVIDTQGPALTRPAQFAPTGTRYAMEADCRIVEKHEGDPLVGFAFGYRTGDTYMLFLTDKELILNRAQGGERADVARLDVTPADLGTWHRLGVIVQGIKIEAYLDGKKVAEHEAKQRQNLTGELGVYTQNCKAEIRLLQFGELGP